MTKAGPVSLILLMSLGSSVLKLTEDQEALRADPHQAGGAVVNRAGSLLRSIRDLPDWVGGSEAAGWAIRILPLGLLVLVAILAMCRKDQAKPSAE